MGDYTILRIEDAPDSFGGIFPRGLDGGDDARGNRGQDADEQCHDHQACWHLHLARIEREEDIVEHFLHGGQAELGQSESQGNAE